MKPFAILALALATIDAAGADGWLEKLRLRKAQAATVSASALSQDEIANGLKAALSRGVEQAITSLGKTNGFLKDPAVAIPMPESLQKVERTLRNLRQEKLADEFVLTLNRAAERAVPEAASVLGDSLKQMSITDAREILTGGDHAATEYFRRSSETNLLARFLPIVKQATEEAGATSAYKSMAGKVSGGFGGFGGNLLTLATPDIDAYVAQKTLDGLFLKIAEQEKLIRENPKARATDLLQKVFGAARK